MKKCPKCNRVFAENETLCPFDMIELTNYTPESLIGTILDRRYRIVEKIGEGGMGKVFKAEHIILGKPFAIKVLNPELAQREDSLKRFINEAKLTSKIGHQNIIEVTDFGKTPTGSFYFVMEHIKGRTLYELLNEKKTIQIDIAHQILIQCADALYAAHKVGIVHRDVKPDNIMLVENGDNKHFVKILDFGISKIATNSNNRLTSAGIIIGTPEYMSPEQASQETIDHRTDIYSLGVIMYQMLTGNLPFTSNNTLNLLMMHKTKSPKPLRSYNPKIKPEIESVCLKCLEKSPEDRYQDMKEFINSLNDAIKNEGKHTSMPRLNSQKASSSIEIQDIPPADIPPEKIVEVRNKLFEDSNNVWFDPYSSPEQNKNEEPEKQPELKNSIIIDNSNVEKSEEIPLQNNNYPADPEIKLATEVEEPPKKVKTPPHKPQPVVAERQYTGKTTIKPQKKISENLFTRKNITIGIISLIVITLLLSFIIYKTATSGIGNIDKSKQFNIPVTASPPPMEKNEQEKLQEKNQDSEQEQSKSGIKTKKEKIKQKQEKVQTTKAEPPKAEYMEYYKQANNYFKQGKYDMAAEYYKSSIRSNPDFAMAYRGLGACYAMLGKSELSIKQYEKYVELEYTMIMEDEL